MTETDVSVDQSPSRLATVREALTGTMKINPDHYSPITSRSRQASLGYAIAGWLYMLRRQKNTRIQAAASIIVLLLALWLQVDFVSMALLIVTITIVWMAEFINAAVEAAINLSTQEYHPMARVGKDVASAAVLLGVVASVLVGLLILGPPLLLRLGLIPR
jgi:diacylglycerol kinase